MTTPKEIHEVAKEFESLGYSKQDSLNAALMLNRDNEMQWFTQHFQKAFVTNQATTPSALELIAMVLEDVKHHLK